MTLKPKTKILLASLLKPVDDPRMFEKFGLALSSTGRFDVHISGYATDKDLSSHPDIHFHPLFNFRRISLARLMAPWKFYVFLLKVKPEVIIANSHDFQAVMVLYKILFGTKLLYDVQENYYLNILFTDAFPSFFRPFLAAFVRTKESVCSPFFDRFFLAEKVYAEQLTFIGSRYTVLENKYEPILPLSDKKRVRIDPKKRLDLVFTGTLALHYGVLDAIQFANEISNYCSVSLRIIGRCADWRFLRLLKAIVDNNPIVALTGGENPVDHALIIRAVQSADLGIVAYRQNRSTRGRIPTKIFEYIANKLPFIVLHEAEWMDLPLKFNACIPVENGYNPQHLLKELLKRPFYDTKTPLDEILWEGEKEKLLKAMEKELP